MTTKKLVKKRKTKVQRRLEVVKDAIKQLKLKNIKAQSGEVLDISSNKLLDAKYEQKGEVKPFLNKLLRTKQKNKVCNACARGTLLICTINKENNFTFDDLNNVYTNKFDPESTVDKRLLSLFSPKQLALIEEAFEQESGISFWHTNREAIFNDKYLTEEEAIKAHMFHDRYKTDDERLLAIFENILKNKGLFKP